MAEYSVFFHYCGVMKKILVKDELGCIEVMKLQSLHLTNKVTCQTKQKQDLAYNCKQ